MVEPIENQQCPYCGCMLKRIPLGKTKCHNCHNYFYVRATVDGKRCAVTELEKEKFDALRKKTSQRNRASGYNFFARHATKGAARGCGRGCMLFIIPFLALILIFSFALACNGESKASSTTETPEEETAQEAGEEEIIKNVAEEEVITEEMIEGDDNKCNAEIEYEIIYTLKHLRYDDGIAYYVLINPIDFSDDTFKDNIKEIIRKIVEEKGKKISIEIFDKKDSLQNGYEYDAEDPGEWLEYSAEELEEWKAWITNEEILNDLAIHCIASYDGGLETGLYLNTLYFFIYSESDNAENPEIDKYVDIIQFNP